MPNRGNDIPPELDPSPERPLSAADSVARHLRDGIVSGTFSPGHKFVEGEITSALGVSRGPVREGLRRLVAEGLVEWELHRPAAVRKLSRREVIELLQIRGSMEMLATSLAARNIHDPDVRARFASAVEPVWSVDLKDDFSSFLISDRAFHDAILAAADNHQLTALNDKLRLPMILFQNYEASGSRNENIEIMSSSISYHQEIARLILSGNETLAVAAMQLHMDHSMRFFHDLYEADSA